MANYDWLRIPGETLFTDLTTGNGLKTRITALEQGAVGPTMNTEQIEAYIQGIMTTQAPSAFNPRGAYVATDSYTKPDTVVGSDGNTYICKSTDPVTGIDPTTDVTAWTIFVERGLQGLPGPNVKGDKGDPGQNAVANITPRGIYSASATYSKDDSVVASDNNSYLCLLDNTKNINPVGDLTGHWCFFVMQGPQGIQGLPGKDAPAASIALSSLTPSLQKEINAATALVNGSACGSWGEIDTGKQFRGKKVFRQDFTLYVNAAPGTVDFTLISTPNYVDTIISQGGMWSIGFQTEKHAIPGTIDSTNASQCIIYGTDNVLVWRSKANNTRTSAQALIIVEYTKK